MLNFIHFTILTGFSTKGKASFNNELLFSAQWLVFRIVFLFYINTHFTNRIFYRILYIFFCFCNCKTSQSKRFSIYKFTCKKSHQLRNHFRKKINSLKIFIVFSFYIRPYINLWKILMKRNCKSK